MSNKAFDRVRQFVKEFQPVRKYCEKLFNRNRIFIDRCTGVSPITVEQALSYSWTGPLLRAAGLDYDVRVLEPYSSYEDFEFEIPVGTGGDCYDRFIVRHEEIWQSFRLIEQALETHAKEPKGVFHADVPNFYLPPQGEVYNRREALL